MSKLPNSNNDTKDQPPSTPRWVKVSAVIVIILVLLIIILKLTGIGGNHGPGRHFQGGESYEQLDQNAPIGQLLSSNHMTSEGDH
ncbi:hypothetical protein ACJ2A9_19470 [Anaerobacillus sp. MEB173]|uniref:hypothetical protein n=1 Tax=Anaerobacillus sp. MEB173 TaxID=3383345 RepID=UPI003F930082